MIGGVLFPRSFGAAGELSYLDLELSIGMLVAPVPIIVSISLTKPIEVLIFSMAFLGPHAVGSILAFIPFVVVIVLGVMITSSFLPMFVVRGKRGRCHNKWGY
jgi:hypothetical protein